MNRKFSLSSDSTSYSISVNNETKMDYNLSKKLHSKMKKESNNLKRSKNNKTKSEQKDDVEKDKNSIESDSDHNLTFTKPSSKNRTVFNVENEKKTKNNFILEKFLTETSQDKSKSDDNKPVSVKPPVPLPRSSKAKKNDSSSSISDKTYSVPSPKIVDQVENASVSSGATYNIECETKPKKSSSSDNNCVIIPVGDIVIHRSPPDKNLIQVVRNKQTNKSTEDDNSSIDIPEKRTIQVTHKNNNYQKNNLKSDNNVTKSKVSKKSDGKISKETIHTDNSSDDTEDSEESNTKKSDILKTKIKQILTKRNTTYKIDNDDIAGVEQDDVSKCTKQEDAEDNKSKKTNILKSKIKQILIKRNKNHKTDIEVEKKNDETKVIKQNQARQTNSDEKVNLQRKKITTESIQISSDDDDIVTEEIMKKRDKYKGKNKYGKKDLKESNEEINKKELNETSREQTRKTRRNKHVLVSKNMYGTTESSNEENEDKYPVKRKITTNKVKINDKSNENSNPDSETSPRETNVDANKKKDIANKIEKNVDYSSNDETKYASKENLIKRDKKRKHILEKQGSRKSLKHEIVEDDTCDEVQLNGKELNIKKESVKKKIKKSKSPDIELQEFKTSKSSTEKKRKSNKKPVEDLQSNSEQSDQYSYSYEYLIGVVVYKTDHLLLNSFISHPIVKIHVVDSKTGQYLKKSKTTGFDKMSGENTEEYLGPMITKAFNLQDRRSLVPFWEEMIVFNDDYDYMINYKNHVIIFFEILDFLSFQTASLKYSVEGVNSGWYKVAWAFLKPVGKNGFLNTEAKMRLQLYKPKKYNKKKKPNECNLFEWWASGKWTKYPSTLYVNVKPAKSDCSHQLDTEETNNKSQILLNSNGEIHQAGFKEDTVERTSPKGNSESNQKRIWSRINTQSCKIPNKILLRLKTGNKGCIKMKFSNNGLFLAYGSISESSHTIIIFNVASSEEHLKLSGHLGLIYDLNWSSNDKYLVSASADRTVYIWDISKKEYTPIQVLPHPSFVYCAHFNPKTSAVFTGCYDQIIRIWKSNNAEINSNYDLVQELEGHAGYITSLCFMKNGTTCFSSDSVGVVFEWRSNEDEEWILKRKLKYRELQNTVINCLALHPGSKRLFLCCRDSIHRMVDLSIGCIVQWYRGSLNYRLQLTACLSPCGSLVISPSEDGLVFIWDADTGALQTTFSSYTVQAQPDGIIPHCVQYHPHDHMLAISQHGTQQSVFICVFEKHVGSGALTLNHLSHTGIDNNTNTDEYKKPTSKRKEIVKNLESKNVNLETIIEKLDEVIGTARSDKSEE